MLKNVGDQREGLLPGEGIVNVAKIRVVGNSESLQGRGQRSSEVLEGRESGTKFGARIEDDVQHCERSASVVDDLLVVSI